MSKQFHYKFKVGTKKQVVAYWDCTHLFSLADERQDTRKRSPKSREPEPQSRASDYSPAIFSIASNISFNRDSKEKKRLISQPLIQLTVGMTRLELATSRPPDACATNCATSRKRVQRYNVFLKPPNLLGFFCEKNWHFSQNSLEFSHFTANKWRNPVHSTSYKSPIIVSCCRRQN